MRKEHCKLLKSILGWKVIRTSKFVNIFVGLIDSIVLIRISCCCCTYLRVGSLIPSSPSSSSAVHIETDRHRNWRSLSGLSLFLHCPFYWQQTQDQKMSSNIWRPVRVYTFHTGSLWWREVQVKIMMMVSTERWKFCIDVQLCYFSSEFNIEICVGS